MKNSIRFWFPILAFMVCVSSCSNERQNTNSISNTDTFYAEFNRNKELWRSQNIKNYKMTVEASRQVMNLPKPTLIEVRNSKAESITSLEKGNPHTKGMFEYFDTVEKLFDLIEETKSKGPARLNVRYDKTLGYPAEIDLEERKDISDDEFWFKVISLEVSN